MRITCLTVYRKVQELDEVAMMFLIHSESNSGIWERIYIQSPYKLVNSATYTGSGFSSVCLKIVAWHSYSVQPREKKKPLLLLLLFLLSHIESVCGLHKPQDIILLFQPETFPSDQDNCKYAKLALMKSHSLSISAYAKNSHIMILNIPDALVLWECQ